MFWSSATLHGYSETRAYGWCYQTDNFAELRPISAPFGGLNNTQMMDTGPVSTATTKQKAQKKLWFLSDGTTNNSPLEVYPALNPAAENHMKVRVAVKSNKEECLFE